MIVARICLSWGQKLQNNHVTLVSQLNTLWDLSYHLIQMFLACALVNPQAYSQIYQLYFTSQLTVNVYGLVMSCVFKPLMTLIDSKDTFDVQLREGFEGGNGQFGDDERVERVVTEMDQPLLV